MKQFYGLWVLIIAIVVGSQGLLYCAAAPETVKNEPLKLKDAQAMIEKYRKKHSVKFNYKTYGKEQEKTYGITSPGMIDSKMDIDALEYLIKDFQKEGDNKKAKEFEKLKEFLENRFSLTRKNAEAVAAYAE